MTPLLSLAHAAEVDMRPMRLELRQALIAMDIEHELLKAESKEDEKEERANG